MKKIKKFLIPIIITLFLLGLFSFGFIQFNHFLAKEQDKIDNTELTQEELVDTVKPGVVRIVQKVKGQAKFPSVWIELDDVDYSETSDPLIEQPVEEIFTGSGFVVNPDGYIATNSHVVSDSETKRSLAESYALDLLYYVETNTPVEAAPNYFANESNFDVLMGRLTNYFLEKMTVDYKNEVYVLDPNSKKEDFDGLLADSFIAEVIYVNDNFAKDEKDVALLKINKTSLPSLKLGDFSKVSTGNKVFAMGFPGTADIASEKNLNVVSYTQGAVSALKDTMGGNFKAIQMDVKIAGGSSGGPLLNKNGDVIGINTFGTSPEYSAGEEVFGYALTVDIVKEMLKEKGVENKEGEFNGYFTQGIGLLKSNRCAKSQEQFKKAETEDELGIANKKIEEYEEKCQEIIDAGNSIDSKSAEFKLWLGTIDKIVWVIVGSLFLLVVIAVGVIIWLAKRLEKDEHLIHDLEKRDKTL